MDKDVKAYFASIPGPRSKRANALHELIVERFPDATVDMKYKMPTYRFADGWVALANQKNYVSLYTCGAHHLAEFKKRHPGIKTGKGCINFRDSDQLPLEDVKSVIEHAILHPKGG